jgi:hypothetical protein
MSDLPLIALLLLPLPPLLLLLSCSLGQLERSNAYLVQHSGMAAVRQALQHSQQVFNRALEQCDADFRASLAAGTRAAAPPAAWLRSKLEVPITGEAGDGGWGAEQRAHVAAIALHSVLTCRQVTKHCYFTQGTHNT